MKIGFIGLGNMGKAIIGGMLKKNVAAKEDIIGYDKFPKAAQDCKAQFGITIASDNRATASAADILVLAVKPIFLADVMQEIRDAVRKETVIISIVAGKTIADLEGGLGEEKKIVRCMPNTPALVLEGCTGVCVNANVSETEEQQVLALLSSFGRASLIPERLMDAVVGVSGSSPAYVFLFLEALADAAVAAGMPRQQAYEFAAQSVMGSAKLMLETGMHPGQLKDMVYSPGGTTIEAVKVLEERGFRGIVMDAVSACVEKSKNL